jgi:hypothetical protein
VHCRDEQTDSRQREIWQGGFDKGLIGRLGVHFPRAYGRQACRMQCRRLIPSDRCRGAAPASDSCARLQVRMCMAARGQGPRLCNPPGWNQPPPVLIFLQGQPAEGCAKQDEWSVNRYAHMPTPATCEVTYKQWVCVQSRMGVVTTGWVMLPHQQCQGTYHSSHVFWPTSSAAAVHSMRFDCEISSKTAKALSVMMNMPLHRPACESKVVQVWPAA